MVEARGGKKGRERIIKEVKGTEKGGKKGREVGEGGEGGGGGGGRGEVGGKGDGLVLVDDFEFGFG